jgi:PhnB protein
MVPARAVRERGAAMATKVKPVPEGYHTLTPYVIVKGASAAIDFYRKAFGAEELVRMPMPGGLVGHAELQLGDSRLMMADEMPESGAKSPSTLRGTTAGLCLYVPDVDAIFKRAVDAGAKVVRPVQDQFYGDRSGTVEDPFGHQWTLATHIEDVSPEEMARRMANMPAPG